MFWGLFLIPHEIYEAIQAFIDRVGRFRIAGGEFAEVKGSLRGLRRVGWDTAGGGILEGTVFMSTNIPATGV